MTPKEVYAWAGYNFIFYAAIPYLFFRRQGYSNEALCLKSSNVRNDTLVIVVLLALTSLGSLPMKYLMESAPKHIAEGAAIAFVLSLFGTGLPIMIFLCAILVPRYRRLSESTATATILGGFTYAALHLTEYWTRYDSAEHGALSAIFVVLLYGGPGMVKAFVTQRTGNAWAHLWGYHAIAPHVTSDTPTFVRIFGVQ